MAFGAPISNSRFGMFQSSSNMDVGGNTNSSISSGIMRRGSAIAPYVATQGFDQGLIKFQSISAMQVYNDKSHEELRFEDYEAKILENEKGVSRPIGVQCGTPATMFCQPTTSNQTTSNSPFGPFRSNSQSPFNAPSNYSSTISNNPFSTQRNPFAPQSPNFLNPYSTTTFPTPSPATNPFSTNSSNIFAPTTSVSPFSFSSSTNVFSPQSQNWFNPGSTTTMTPANVTASPFSQTNLFSTQSQASVTSASTVNPFSAQTNFFSTQSQASVTPAITANPFSAQTNPFANRSQAFVTPASTTTSTPWNNSSANPFSSQTNPFATQSQAFVNPSSTTSTSWNNSSASLFSPQNNPFATQPQAFVAPSTTTTSTPWNSSSANSFFSQTNPFATQSQAFNTPTSTTSTSWNNSSASLFSSQTNSFATQSQPFMSRTSTTTSTPWNNSSANPFSQQTNFFATQSQSFITPTSTATNTPWNCSSANPFSPQTNAFATQSQPFVTPSSTIPMTPGPVSENPFSRTNLFTPSSQAPFSPNITNSFTSMPAKSWNFQPNSFTPSAQLVTSNNYQSSQIATTFTSSTIIPSMWSTSVTTLGTCMPVLSFSHPGQISATIPNQPAQFPSSSATVAEVGNQFINGQQCASSSTLGLVMDPFSLRSPINTQAGAVTPFTRGISSLPRQVLENPTPFRMASTYRIKHMSRRISLPAAQSSGSKVPFFSHKEDTCSVAPLPRENPRAWVMNTMSGQHHARLDISKKGEVCEEEARTSPCFQVNANSIEINNDTLLQEKGSLVIEKLHEADNPSMNKKNTADVSALLPKLPLEDYYTEPSIKELEDKEKVDPGFCSRVKNFVVGRKDKGSIKFLGETDIRQLDISSIIQFNEREVIVYSDERQKPPVGQGLNRPAEITLLNVKCFSKNTGEQHTDGPLVQKLERKLMKVATVQGAQFVSYNPIRAEWKFRVEHF